MASRDAHKSDANDSSLKKQTNGGHKQMCSNELVNENAKNVLPETNNSIYSKSELQKESLKLCSSCEVKKQTNFFHENELCSNCRGIRKAQAQNEISQSSNCENQSDNRVVIGSENLNRNDLEDKIHHEDFYKQEEHQNGGQSLKPEVKTADVGRTFLEEEAILDLEETLGLETLELEEHLHLKPLELKEENSNSKILKKGSTEQRSHFCKSDILEETFAISNEEDANVCKPERLEDNFVDPNEEKSIFDESEGLEEAFTVPSKEGNSSSCKSERLENNLVVSKKESSSSCSKGNFAVSKEGISNLYKPEVLEETLEVDKGKTSNFYKPEDSKETNVLTIFNSCELEENLAVSKEGISNFYKFEDLEDTLVVPKEENFSNRKPDKLEDSLVVSKEGNSNFDKPEGLDGTLEGTKEENSKFNKHEDLKENSRCCQPQGSEKPLIVSKKSNSECYKPKTIAVHSERNSRLCNPEGLVENGVISKEGNTNFHVIKSEPNSPQFLESRNLNDSNFAESVLRFSRNFQEERKTDLAENEALDVLLELDGILDDCLKDYANGNDDEYTLGAQETVETKLSKSPRRKFEEIIERKDPTESNQSRRNNERTTGDLVERNNAPRRNNEGTTRDLIEGKNALRRNIEGTTRDVNKSKPIEASPRRNSEETTKRNNTESTDDVPFTIEECLEDLEEYLRSYDEDAFNSSSPIPLTKFSHLHSDGHNLCDCSNSTRNFHKSQPYFECSNRLYSNPQRYQAASLSSHHHSLSSDPQSLPLTSDQSIRNPQSINSFNSHSQSVHLASDQNVRNLHNLNSVPKCANCFYSDPQRNLSSNHHNVNSDQRRMSPSKTPDVKYLDLESRNATSFNSDQPNKPSNANNINRDPRNKINYNLDPTNEVSNTNKQGSFDKLNNPCGCSNCSMLPRNSIIGTSKYATVDPCGTSESSTNVVPVGSLRNSSAESCRYSAIKVYGSTKNSTGDPYGTSNISTCGLDTNLPVDINNTGSSMDPYGTTNNTTADPRGTSVNSLVDPCRTYNNSGADPALNSYGSSNNLNPDHYGTSNKSIVDPCGGSKISPVDPCGTYKNSIVDYASNSYVSFNNSTADPHGELNKSIVDLYGASTNSPVESLCESVKHDASNFHGSSNNSTADPYRILNKSIVEASKNSPIDPCERDNIFCRYSNNSASNSHGSSNHSTPDPYRTSKKSIVDSYEASTNLPVEQCGTVNTSHGFSYSSASNSKKSNTSIVDPYGTSKNLIGQPCEATNDSIFVQNSNLLTSHPNHLGINNERCFNNLGTNNDLNDNATNSHGSFNNPIFSRDACKNFTCSVDYRRNTFSGSNPSLLHQASKRNNWSSLPRQVNPSMHQDLNSDTNEARQINSSVHQVLNSDTSQAQDYNAFDNNGGGSKSKVGSRRLPGCPNCNSEGFICSCGASGRSSKISPEGLACKSKGCICSCGVSLRNASGGSSKVGSAGLTGCSNCNSKGCICSCGGSSRNASDPALNICGSSKSHFDGGSDSAGLIGGPSKVGSGCPNYNSERFICSCRESSRNASGGSSKICSVCPNCNSEGFICKCGGSSKYDSEGISDPELNICGSSRSHFDGRSSISDSDELNGGSSKIEYGRLAGSSNCYPERFVCSCGGSSRNDSGEISNLALNIAGSHFDGSDSKGLIDGPSKVVSGGLAGCPNCNPEGFIGNCDGSSRYEFGVISDPGLNISGSHLDGESSNSEGLIPDPAFNCGGCLRSSSGGINSDPELICGGSSKGNISDPTTSCGGSSKLLITDPAFNFGGCSRSSSGGINSDPELICSGSSKGMISNTAFNCGGGSTLIHSANCEECLRPESEEFISGRPMSNGRELINSGTSKSDSGGLIHDPAFNSGGSSRTDPLVHSAGCSGCLKPESEELHSGLPMPKEGSSKSDSEGLSLDSAFDSGGSSTNASAGCDECLRPVSNELISGPTCNGGLIPDLAYNSDECSRGFTLTNSAGCGGCFWASSELISGPNEEELVNGGSSGLIHDPAFNCDGPSRSSGSMCNCGDLVSGRSLTSNAAQLSSGQMRNYGCSRSDSEGLTSAPNFKCGKSSKSESGELISGHTCNSGDLNNGRCSRSDSEGLRFNSGGCSKSNCAGLYSGETNSGPFITYGQSNSGTSINYGESNSGPSITYGGSNSGSSINYGGSNSGPSINYGESNSGPSINYGDSNSGPFINYGGSNSGPSINYGESNSVPSINYGESNSGPFINYGGSNSGPSINHGRSNSGPSFNYAESNSGPSINYGGSNSGPSINYEESNSGLTFNCEELLSEDPASSNSHVINLDEVRGFVLNVGDCRLHTDQHQRSSVSNSSRDGETGGEMSANNESAARPLSSRDALTRNHAYRATIGAPDDVTNRSVVVEDSMATGAAGGDAKRPLWLRTSMRRLQPLPLPSNQNVNNAMDNLTPPPPPTGRPISAPSRLSSQVQRSRSRDRTSRNPAGRARSSSASSRSRRPRSVSSSVSSVVSSVDSTSTPTCTPTPAQHNNSPSEEANNVNNNARRTCERPSRTHDMPEAESPLGQWPHSLSSTLAYIGCTLGIFNISRFAILSVHFGANFILQFLLITFLIGLPIFTLQLCLGQQLGAGVIDMWRISPMFQGVGVSLLFFQALTGIYSIIGVSWMFVYFRDAFVTKFERYRWAEPFIYYRDDIQPPINGSYKLTETVPDYLSGIVFQRHHLVSGSTYGTIKFQPAFNLAVVWMIVFVSLSKGLRSYGKVIYVFTLLPIFGMFVLCAKLLGMMPPELINNVFPETSWNEFFINPRSWLAACQEVFLTWGMLGAAVMQIASHNKNKRLLQRDSGLIAVITITILLLVAFLANTCVQILKANGFSYQPDSFEKLSTYTFMRHKSNPLPPNLASTPVKYMVHNSFIVGDRISRPGNDPTSESGYQVLRFATELIPSTFAILGTDQVSPFWTVLFYFILILFGIAQQLAIWHCVITGIMAIKAKVLKSWETTITFFSCACGFILGLPMTTEFGIYVVYFMDLAIGGVWWLILIVLLQIIAVFMVRGRPYSGDALVTVLFHSNNYKCLLSWAPALLSFTWNVVLPVVLMVWCIAFFKNGNFRELFIWHHGPSLEYWPLWARQIGAMLQLLPVLAVPFIAVIQSYRYLNNGPNDILDRIQLLYRPPIGEHMDDLAVQEAAAAAMNNTATNPATNIVIEDPPPKYTPPPSYTTATGARIAKMLRQSIRRSVRRIANVLGESSGIRRPAQPSEPPPPDYNAVLVEMNASPSRSSAEMIQRELATIATSSTGLTAADVASILRSSFRRSTIRTLRRDNDQSMSSLSAENLIDSAAPIGETSLVLALNLSESDNDKDGNNTSSVI